MDWKIIKKNDQYLNPTVLIKQGSSQILTEANVMLLKGESGSGKSRVAMNVMVGFSGASEGLGFEYTICPTNKYVIYISTEMSDHDIQRRLVKILEQCPPEYEDRLVMVNIENSLDKFKSLTEVLAEYPPHAIIVDQIGDFVSNINDLDICTAFTSTFLTTIRPYSCGAIAILHQNEDGGIGKKARGHLGSILEQKVSCSMAIADHKKGFTLKSTKMRNGAPVMFSATFDETTEMLKLNTEREEVSKKNIIFDQLILPGGKTEVCKQIGRLSGLKQYQSQLKMLQEYIDSGKLKEDHKGRDHIISKVDNGTLS